MTASPARTRGRVTLVGAGPGDPELLTLAAVKALASADVVLVDDLVNPAVLAHASPIARVVHVGKRGPCRVRDPRKGSHRPSTPQAFIDRLMAAEALRGRHVVRLKGGDPFVFGRGGEERAMLMARGIPVDVIPGVSSGIAAPASIGVPLTHRAYSQGAIFVTGHRRGDRADDDATRDVDWKALAATGLTLVIYMGVARCREIVDALMAGGMAQDTPAAAIESACSARQRQVVTTVRALPDAMAGASIASPAILVIGDVVRCADAADAAASLAAEALTG